MAREKHPSFHNPVIQRALSSSRYDIIIAAFATQSQLAEFRRKLYALRRAHNLWRTPESSEFANFKSRQFPTREMKKLKPTYEVDEFKYPITLVFTCQEVNPQQPDNTADIEQTPIFSERGEQLDRSQPLPEKPEDFNITDSTAQYLTNGSFENDNLLDIIGGLTDEDANEDLN